MIILRSVAVSLPINTPKYEMQSSDVTPSEVVWVHTGLDEGKLCCDHNVRSVRIWFILPITLGCTPSVLQPCDRLIYEGFPIRGLVIFNCWSIIAGTLFSKCQTCKHGWTISVPGSHCLMLWSNLDPSITVPSHHEFCIYDYYLFIDFPQRHFLSLPMLK